jgi:hypothetical protein
MEKMKCSECGKEYNVIDLGLGYLVICCGYPLIKAMNYKNKKEKKGISKK